MKRKKKRKKGKEEETIFNYSLPTSHNKCGLHYRDQSLNVAATFLFLFDR